MSWHKISLTHSQVANKEHGRIAQFFGEMVRHLKDENSKNVAMLTRYPPDEDFQMYFTPEASDLAGTEILEHYGAVPCDPPIKDQYLLFSSGDPSVLLRLRNS